MIDKMPHNYRHLGMIAVLFPRARVVHCRRDALDVCVSAYFQNFGELPYATSLTDLGFYFRQYERLMEHWRTVLPLRMHEVVYEEMVANQERVSRDLIAYCGLSWDERCLEFYKLTRAVRTASKLQVRQPIYTHAVARWKRYEAYLQPLRDELAGPHGDRDGRTVEPSGGRGGSLVVATIAQRLAQALKLQGAGACRKPNRSIAACCKKRHARLKRCTAWASCCTRRAAITKRLRCSNRPWRRTGPIR